MRSPSVRKSNIPKPTVVETSYEALADLKRTLSKKKLTPQENEPNEECDSSKLKKSSYKRASTPENQQKREFTETRDKTPGLNQSGSKQNLHPTLSREPSVSKDLNVTKEGNTTKDTNDRALLEEVEKWKKFGKMMADSYEDLNNKFTSFMKESEKDKKVIHALKEQVPKLQQS
jgi:archaellum component FlaC